MAVQHLLGLVLAGADLGYSVEEHAMKLTVVIQVYAEGDKLIVYRTEVDTTRDRAVRDTTRELNAKLKQWDKDQKTFEDNQG
jgi:hypothetical protein